jgi:predicted transcriptional regulator
MGMLDKLFGQKKKAILYSLNELGKSKAEQIIGSNGIRLKVINYLDEHGSSSVSEISAGLQLPQEQIKTMLDKLCREQWVTTVKNSGMD